jgi:hypothetical protein
VAECRLQGGEQNKRQDTASTPPITEALQKPKIVLDGNAIRPYHKTACRRWQPGGALFGNSFRPRLALFVHPPWPESSLGCVNELTLQLKVVGYHFEV